MEPSVSLTLSLPSRSSLSDLRDSLHERVSSLGDWPNGGVPSSPPGDLRGASEVRGRDRSRGRGVATSQLKRAKMRRGEWYSSCFCFVSRGGGVYMAGDLHGRAREDSGAPRDLGKPGTRPRKTLGTLKTYSWEA